jgi:hypothetical protein
MKKCSRCQTEKPSAAFSSNKTTRDGKQNRCKRCVKEYYTKPKNKIKISAYQAKYYTNPTIREKRLAYQSEYYSRDENKVRQSLRTKVYNSKPEIRKRNTDRRRKYQSRPEIKNKKSIYQAMYRYSSRSETSAYRDIEKIQQSCGRQEKK